jgi:DnaK suppressor protein
MASKTKAVVKTTKIVTKVAAKKVAKPSAKSPVKAKVLVKAAVSLLTAPKIAAKTASKVVTKPVKPIVKAVVKVAAKTPIKSPTKVVVKAAASKKPVKVEQEIIKQKPGKVAVNPPIVTKLPASGATETLSVKPYLAVKIEEYMNEAQQAHFRELLHVWRATLATKIDTAVSHLKDDPKHFADLNDRATQEEEFNLELKARDREADLVAKIDEALKRLHEGDYGYCEECGIEIGIRRLEARPTATLCIDCKTLAEMRERQAGGL